MSKVLVTEGHLNSIAEAIRSKNHAATTYRPGDMAAAIQAIPTGVTPTGTVNISQNGTHDVTQYANANVNVQPTLQTKTAIANGDVEPDSGYDGLSKVTVNVTPTLQSKTVTSNGTVMADSGYDGLSQVVVNVPSGTLPTIPTLPSDYQEVEYVVFDGASWLRVSPAKAVGILYIDAEQDDVMQKSIICGYREGSTTWNDWYIGNSGESTGQRWFFRGGMPFGDFPTIPSGNRVVSNALILFTSGSSTSQTPTIRYFFIGSYYNNTTSAAYGPMKGKIRYVRILAPSTNQWANCFVPCYRKSDNAVGFYDVVNSVFYTNVGSGTLLAGPNIA